MIAVIPTEGAIHAYEPPSYPLPMQVKSPVRVSLTRDEDTVGWVTFGVHETEPNERATEATFLLSGAYVRIVGDAKFDVRNEDLMYDVIREVS